MNELADLQTEYEGVFATTEGLAVPEGREQEYAEHFRHYLPPMDECPRCSRWRAAARWGIVHGQMVCGECGYPATMYHFIGETRVVGFLWVHPSEVTQA